MSESLFIKQMSALSEPTRLKIVYILSLQSFCAMHLEEIIGVSQSNVSRHVDKLISSKIVTMEKVGRRKIYSLDPKFVEENAQILMQIKAIYAEEYTIKSIKALGIECLEMK